MPNIAEPPAAPAAPVTVAPGAVPAPQLELRVSDLPVGPPTPPPAPGSRRAQMMKELRQKAGSEPSAEPPKEAVALPQKPAEPPVAAEKPPVTEAGKKANPWKIVDEYKARLTAAEKRALDLEKSVVPEEKRKEADERLARAEARAKELEDEIRFVDYTKSAEFKKEYQEPYEAGWKRAVGELDGLEIDDPETGASRKVTADDLLQLLNLPLGQARKLANERYGDFADDMMTHRKSIRELFDKQNAALENMRKTGADRDKQRQEEFQKIQSQMGAMISETWKQANDQVMADERYGRYFKPAEGDQDGNQRLAKGYQLADRALSENPAKPGLAPEERRAIIQRHAALRNRAAAFGRLAFQNQKLEQEVASLKEQLGQFKASVPGTGKPGGDAVAAPGSRMDQMTAALRKLAQ